MVELGAVNNLGCPVCPQRIARQPYLAISTPANLPQKRMLRNLWRRIRGSSCHEFIRKLAGALSSSGPRLFEDDGGDDDGRFFCRVHDIYGATANRAATYQAAPRAARAASGEKDASGGNDSCVFLL